MPPEARTKQGVLESEFLFKLTQGYVKEGVDSARLPNTYGYRECVGYAARAAMFLALGRAEHAREYLEKAKLYGEFTTGRVPELDVFIETTAARAAFVGKKFQEAKGCAERAQQMALTLNGTTSEMKDYLLYVTELSIQIQSYTPPEGSIEEVEAYKAS